MRAALSSSKSIGILHTMLSIDTGSGDDISLFVGDGIGHEGGENERESLVVLHGLPSPQKRTRVESEPSHYLDHANGQRRVVTRSISSTGKQHDHSEIGNLKTDIDSMKVHTSMH
jgi:hypothetical protein